MSSTIGFLRPLVILSVLAPYNGTTRLRNHCSNLFDGDGNAFFAGISFSHFMLLIGLFIILGVIAVYAEPYRMLKPVKFYGSF